MGKKKNTEIEEVKEETIENVPLTENKEEAPLAIKDEESKPEEITEEVKPEEKEPIKLEADHNYEHSSLEAIENYRAEFLKKYKISNGIKLLVGGIGIAVIFAASLVIPSVEAIKDGVKITLMVILTVFALTGMITYNILNKKKMNKKMQTYFDTYYENTTTFAFDNEDFKNVVCNAKDKITDEEFTNNKLWKDVTKVGSRAKTTFTYHDIDMYICDAAGQISVNKGFKPIFVGKYIVAPTTYDSCEPIVIYLKGDKRGIPPTNLEDIKNVYDDSKMAIYSNNSQWSKFVSKKIKEAVLKLETGKDLIDVSISIQAGRVYVCLGYDDSLMVLPLEKPLNARPVKEYRSNLIPACDFIELINK